MHEYTGTFIKMVVVVEGEPSQLQTDTNGNWTLYTKDTLKAKCTVIDLREVTQI